jgi:hypothetical protein
VRLRRGPTRSTRRVQRSPRRTDRLSRLAIVGTLATLPPRDTFRFARRSIHGCHQCVHAASESIRRELAGRNCRVVMLHRPPRVT